MQTFELIAPGAAWRDGDAFIAGGTDLLQLMKNEVVAPRRLVDLSDALSHDIVATDSNLELGALCGMNQTAMHDGVKKQWPAISQALLSAASPQIRNMGTIGGNLLQRTRADIFATSASPATSANRVRDVRRSVATTRTRDLRSSAQCIATHPSDLPVALMAFDAELELTAPGGKTRRVPIAGFYRPPGDTPDIETVLLPGEMIVKVHVQSSAAARNSCYVKVRDRTSFAFALVSAAVGLDIANHQIRDARVLWAASRRCPGA